MHELTFLQDLAIVMAISAAVTVLCHHWRLPVVLGYILAGLIIGPYTPPFPLVRDLISIQTLSELGVIFLLFGIGLEFSLTKLARVGLVSFVAATLEILLMAWIGFCVGQALGWKTMDSLFLGAILSISSTTIIAKILMDMKKFNEPFAHVILGILVIEDLLGIVIVALLSGIATSGALTLREAGTAMLRVGAFVAGSLLLGLWLVPRLLRTLGRFRSGELMVVTTLGLCFGLALIAARLGFSVALGAFLVGAIIAETPQAKEIIHRIEPIRHMFTAIFFVSVGMLLDPKVLAQFTWPIVVIALVTLLGKVFSCSFATFLTGYAPETSLRVGLGLAQIGEFSFIIARLGESTGVTSGFLYPIAVSVSGVTALTTPILMRHTPHIVQALKISAPRPLITLTRLYSAWLERVRTIQSASEKRKAIEGGLRSQLPRLALYVGSALGFIYFIAYAARLLSIPPLVYWSLASILILPLLFAVAYTTDRIIWDIVVMNLMPADEASTQATQAHQVLHHLLRFFSVLVSAVLLLVLSAAFVPVFPIGLSAIALVALASMVLWDAARRLHQQIEHTVLQVFEQERPTDDPQLKRSHDALVQLIQEEYPWEVQTQDFLLPYQESAANQSIRALRLRTITGATIVAIYREPEPLINPLPETILMPGDVLLLMGNREQVAAAMRFLQQKTHEPSVNALSPGQAAPKARTVQVSIPANSPWIGKTLAALNLRRITDAQVVGVRKAEHTITNPASGVVLEAGDTLVLFGNADQLKHAIAYLVSGNNG